MAENENLDLLDLEDDADLTDLPESDPFAGTPRPKKPWLLLGAAVIVIILATYIIIRVVGGNNHDSVDVNLDAPVVVTNEGETPPPAMQPDNFAKDADKVVAGQVKPTPVPQQPVAAPAAPEHAGVPTREVSDRPDVKFNPDKQSVAPPKPRPVEAKSAVRKPIAQKIAKSSAAVSGGWYVQFGAYSTRALAEAGQNKIQRDHPSLLGSRQFVILAAVLPNGKTVYRLRVSGFKSSAEANGFCNNARSDGLDCYVAK